MSYQTNIDLNMQSISDGSKGFLISTTSNILFLKESNTEFSMALNLSTNCNMLWKTLITKYPYLAVIEDKRYAMKVINCSTENAQNEILNKYIFEISTKLKHSRY